MQRKYSNTVIFWMLFGHLGGSLRTPIYWFDNESDINLGSFWRWPFQLKGKDEDLCALKCRNEAVKNQNFLACWKIVLQKLFGTEVCEDIYCLLLWQPNLYTQRNPDMTIPEDYMYILYLQISSSLIPSSLNRCRKLRIL